jgi:hypothetical protein
MGTAFNPAKTSPASWDAFADVDAFVDAVLAELAAMAADGTRRLRSGPKPPLTGAALRKGDHGDLVRCLIAPQQSSLFLQSRYTLSRLWRELAAAER